MAKVTTVLPPERIADLICVVRGHRVILDEDLARLYAVETRAINQAVSRNPDRFPPDFCFRLSKQEVASLKSRIVISKGGRGGRRRSLPRAFTQEGVAMLSSVLRSKPASQVNVAVMRAFVQMRGLIGATRELAQRLEGLERELASVGTRTKQHDELLRAVFSVLEQLTDDPLQKKNRIGF